MINIQETAKSIFDSENFRPFEFVGGILLTENLMAVVVKDKKNQFSYIYQYESGVWAYVNCPKLSYFMDNLKDYLPAKQKFMVEVEVTTLTGERGPEEVFRNFCAKEMLNDDGLSLIHI